MSDEIKNFAISWSSAADYLRIQKNKRTREIQNNKKQTAIIATQTPENLTKSVAEQVRLRWAFASNEDRPNWARRAAEFLRQEIKQYQTFCS